MKKRLFHYFITGAVFVSVLGTLSHFFYEWSGGNRLIGCFAPVNESTWEHIKLLFFPMLLYTLFAGFRSRREYSCVVPALNAGNLLGSALIPVIFYTYSGILGKDNMIMDILTFYLSVAAAFWAAFKLTLRRRILPYDRILKFCVLTLMLLFILFTFFPPEIALFHSP